MLASPDIIHFLETLYFLEAKISHNNFTSLASICGSQGSTACEGDEEITLLRLGAVRFDEHRVLFKYTCLCSFPICNQSLEIPLYEFKVGGTE